MFEQRASDGTKAVKSIVSLNQNGPVIFGPFHAVALNNQPRRSFTTCRENERKILAPPSPPFMYTEEGSLLTHEESSFEWWNTFDRGSHFFSFGVVLGLPILGRKGKKRERHFHPWTLCKNVASRTNPPVRRYRELWRKERHPTGHFRLIPHHSMVTDDPGRGRNRNNWIRDWCIFWRILSLPSLLPTKDRICVFLGIAGHGQRNLHSQDVKISQRFRQN